MDRCGHKIVAKGVHGQQRRGLGHISKIIGKGATGYGRARGGLGANNGKLLAMDLIAHKGKTEPAKVAPPACAANDHIGIHADLFKLFFGLQSIDCLMQKHMIQDASESITGVFVSDRVFNRLTDGETKTAG